MKISTKGRYGVRLMLDLAVHYSQGLIRLKDVASRQEISEKYLEQIINPLNKAGLVRSVRGSQGGYTLSGEPNSITVGDILRVLEGSLSPVECVDKDTVTCNRASACITIGIWRKVKTAIENVVDNITLTDLVDEYNSKNSPNYTI